MRLKSSSSSSSGSYKYCKCRKMRTGIMIQCENETACQREWFHLDCVGLKKAPKGIWFCDSCEKNQK